MGEELLKILVERGSLSPEQAQKLPPEAMSSTKLLEEALLERRLLSEDALIKAKSALFNIPILNLTGREVNADVLRIVPEETVRRYKFVPIEKKDTELIVGMVDPEDVNAREALKLVAVQSHLTPKIFLISKTDLERAAGQYRTLRKEVGTALRELEEEIAREGSSDGKSEKAEGIPTEAPITKVVAVIIRHAVDGGASDIHIEALDEKTRVRFRVDGIMHASIFLPKKIHASIIARIKILSNLKIDERRIPQDGRFSTIIGDKKIDFRVSSFPTAYGEKIVLRILDPRAAAVGDFEDLGLLGRNLEVYKKAIQKPFGLVLITGPTGSGKSTTLYTTLTTKNSEEVNIVTLEDPVEYFIEGVSQAQIRPDIGFTFASGLRSILRQDPDIIMVGEIRDEETALLASHAALTGHLVFSTLHTNNALGIITRLVNMGIEPYLIPPTLVAGAAQRLVRKLCQECLEGFTPTPAQSELIESLIKDVPEKELVVYGIKRPFKLYKSKGCPACGNKGTKGRLAIYEVFEMTADFEEAILGTISEAKLIEVATKQGMITMKQDGIMKALKGLVSIEGVLKVVDV